MINGARTNTGTVGVATLKMASNFKDDETASFTLEGSTFTYTADGSETAAQAGMIINKSRIWRISRLK